MKALTTGFALAAVLAFAACSHKTVTVQSSDGSTSVTTTHGGKAVTMNVKGAQITVGQNAIDASKLGAPIYPGARAGNQGSLSTTTAKGATVVASFQTGDSFEKVYAYYKAHLPSGAEKMKLETSHGSVASFEIGDQNAPDLVSVQVSSERPAVTEILITRVTKAGS